MINDLFRKACSDRQTVRDEVKSKKSALEKELTLHFWLASDAKTQENQLRVRPLWCYHVSLNIGRIKILSATCSHLIGRKTRTEAYINSIFFFNFLRTKGDKKILLHASLLSLCYCSPISEGRYEEFGSCAEISIIFLLHSINNNRV